MVKQNASQSAARSKNTCSLKAARWQAARQAYEDYGVPAELLQLLMGLKPKTVADHIRTHQWHSLQNSDLCHEQQNLVKKLYQVVEAHFEQVAQLEGDEIFSEKKTRALNTLAATIEKLVKINFQSNAVIGHKNEKSEADGLGKKSQQTAKQFSSTEIAEFREKLAKRIEAFVS